uniref:Uncharacterized protein n=1 Tax=Helianthus annuus TaxID=4232 RepID=A0A251VF99_HELAN
MVPDLKHPISRSEPPFEETLKVPTAANIRSSLLCTRSTILLMFLCDYYFALHMFDTFKNSRWEPQIGDCGDLRWWFLTSTMTMEDTGCKSTTSFLDEWKRWW